MRLVVFFDGTWNEPSDRTNVHSIYRRVPDNDEQDTYYIPGVGTKSRGLWDSYKKFLGGAFGDGLSDNILDGYQWLCERYNEGDSIFLFGFSRGAYSARSLAGMIVKCGLVRIPERANIQQAYAIYRDDSARGDEETAEFRRVHSREAHVDFIGVWDTVGALGVPVRGFHFPGFSSYYDFHNTNLSNCTRAAYHALATNEFRSLYEPTLWTSPPGGRPADLPVEQRWFAGAHADVGGGYRDSNHLPIYAERWMCQQAIRHGLEISPLPEEPPAPPDNVPHDSYEQFVGDDVFRRKICKRQSRSFNRPDILNLTVDASLRKRLLEEKDFLSAEPALKDALMNLIRREPSH